MNYDALPDRTDVTLTRDQLHALHALLGLVHYDDLAASWLALLPAELRPPQDDTPAEQEPKVTVTAGLLLERRV